MSELNLSCAARAVWRAAGRHVAGALLLPAFVLALAACSGETPAPAGEAVATVSDSTSAPAASPAGADEVTAVSFITSDEVEIFADYHREPGKTGLPGAVLAHQLGTDRSDWDAVVPVLVEEGYAVLAIDLRGHGASIRRGSTAGGYEDLDYRGFGPDDWNDLTIDVNAAIDFLIESGAVDPDRIAVFGSSIGASAAVRAMAGRPSIRAGVLFSPGSNYRGVNIREDVVLSPEQALFAVAGAHDGQSARFIPDIESVSKAGDTFFQVLESGTHGTGLFAEFGDAGLRDALLEFLRRNV